VIRARARVPRLAFVVCVCALGAWLVVPRSAPLHAQDPAPPADVQESQRPEFRAEANYVRVDVYPTTSGKPIADLTADDFEVFEDGVPQRVEQFELVALSTLTSRDERRDPNTVAEAREQATDPRRRVVVIFLDTHHATFDGSHRARRPIIDMLERLIGPDDLYAVMTPDMDPRSIAFGRRTEALDQAMEQYWTWGQRDGLIRTDREEQELEMCFPENAPPSRCVGPGGSEIRQPANAYRGVAAQLIRRKRELAVLDAFDGLVAYLGALREERKAVIAVTQGWQIYRPKPELTRLQECESPRVPQIGVGPDGRVVGDTARARAGVMGGPAAFDCHERMQRYALLDNFPLFTAVMERANRFNVSFYPLDTRGLAAFDRQLGDRDERLRADAGEWPNRRPAGDANPLHDNELWQDANTLRARLDSMQTLAANTDGLAIVNTNDLAAGARRIVDDLSTYYLLGYYSSNEALDGKWRKITVRVKRPGVQVRARQGYRALRPEDMYVMDAPSTAGGAAATAETTAIDTALATLAGANVTLPWRTNAAWSAGVDGEDGHLWITAELDQSTLRDAAWKAGGALSVTVASAEGPAVADEEVPLAAGVRAVSVPIDGRDLPPGDYTIRLRLRPADGGLPLSDALRVSLPVEAVRVGAPRVLRAGQGLGPGFQATADLRFRRADRLRLELPVAPGATEVSAELLDRTGTVMTAIPVPATLGEPDESGVAWATVTLGLAPLAQGDYVVRVIVVHPAGTTQSLTAFKVV
jgi:VWFA-related protein